MQENKGRRKERRNKTMTKTKNRTEAFHLFFQNIVPIIKEMWTDRCTDKTTPVLGGRIVAGYDSLSKKVTQLYTMRSIVLPEDEIKIFDETLEAKLEETNQQLNIWIHRWRPVIDHSMKRVKEPAKANSKPIWQHFTSSNPTKTRVTRKVTKRKHSQPKKMSNNPLNNVYRRMEKKRSTSRTKVTVAKNGRYTKILRTEMYRNKRKQKSTSRDKQVMEMTRRRK
jgi:hypothetical protein